MFVVYIFYFDASSKSEVFLPARWNLLGVLFALMTNKRKNRFALFHVSQQQKTNNQQFSSFIFVVWSHCLRLCLYFCLHANRSLVIIRIRILQKICIDSVLICCSVNFCGSFKLSPEMRMTGTSASRKFRWVCYHDHMHYVAEQKVAAPSHGNFYPPRS